MASIYIDDKIITWDSYAQLFKEAQRPLGKGHMRG